MKTRVRHGVIGIIIITMGTSIMIYNLRFTRTSPFQSHAAAGPPNIRLGKTQKKPQRRLSSLLEGYTNINDQKPLQMHCNCCALVTSSGHLTSSQRGAEIDRTECVIRMNDAPTAGYHRDVGRRTSLRVVAHSSLQRVLLSKQELLNSSHDTVFLFWGPSNCMRKDGKGLVYNNLLLVNKMLPKLKVYMVSRLKMLKFDELFKKETGKDRRVSNSWLSTGWFSMAIALELCDSINVYGMVAPDFCRSFHHSSMPYHYYEPSGPDECTMYLSHEQGRGGSHHRFITEKTVFANWARTFNIHFYQPDWLPAPLLATNNSHIDGPAGS
ncbi:alpha-N-acetylgalactosaminide alpha-2,6-sialyltransferase 5b [Hypomesus transpacificus]|uniref:alpha-N-acetylgalactosaminide alpha-2,6-sialyltransferase 5b n=1 Tax=Hypomesus transpacificus TaxID=137520 RepID=UPI001F071D6C|nr:alpha-N-acetylgalactosaminide alpha-2,6-sialyltransferase 5b [Hypomesus transpacificus]